MRGESRVVDVRQGGREGKRARFCEYTITVFPKKFSREPSSPRSLERREGHDATQEPKQKDEEK
jgi:hypothetical protein